MAATGRLESGGGADLFDRPSSLSLASHARWSQADAPQPSRGRLASPFGGWIPRPRSDPRPPCRRVCWSLPPQEFRHGRETRRLVRRAMAGLVPDEIRLRTARGSQAPDVFLHLSRRRNDLRDAVEFIAHDELCVSLVDLPWLRETIASWPMAPSREFRTRLIPFCRAISLGLYVRWINEGLTALPGARPPRPPIIERS